MTPKTCRLVDVILKTANPNKMVFKGVSEFKIEITALSISVPAMANKNAGKKEPKKPDIASHFHSFFEIEFSLLYPAANKNKPVMIVRKAPN